MSRFQQGSLRKEERKKGPQWVLRYYATRPVDGKRVEKTLVVGPVSKFASENAAWREVNRLGLDDRINEASFTGAATIKQIAAHYQTYELAEDALHAKAHTTANAYKGNLKLRVIPRWGDRLAVSIESLEVEQWLGSLRKSEGLANGTLVKTRNVMRLMFAHALRHKLIPVNFPNPITAVRCKMTTTYEPVQITPEQAALILSQLPQAEHALVLLSACTGLRASEALGLKWGDLDPRRACIHIRRSWTSSRVGNLKTTASRASVPMSPLLEECLNRWRSETPYAENDDWIFASPRMKGKQPRTANILVQDHLRPAAIAAGVLSKESKERFGLHNLRHALATFLVTDHVADPKTVQLMLRHSNVTTTLGLYAHGNNAAKLTAQEAYLSALFPKPGQAENAIAGGMRV